MSNQQVATLILRTMDLTLNSTTNVGVSNSMGTDMTFYNINMRTLLGDIYDKFEYFNLQLKQISTGVAASAAGTVLDDRNILVYMSGLPFVNQTYSQKTGYNTTDVLLTNFNQTISVSTNYVVNNNKSFTFAKNEEVCSLRIYYKRVLDDAIPTTAVAFPKTIFMFEIVGIDKAPNSKNATRMLQ